MKPLAAGLVLTVIVVVVAGCASSKYQTAPERMPPAVLFNFMAAQPPAEAVLHSVIIFGGPGSWKREAYWDEYVVSIVNRGTVPWSLEQATLEDFQGAINSPGQNPWQLEDETNAWWQKVKSSQAGHFVAIGAVSVAVASTLAVGALMTSPFGLAASATGTALAGAATGVLVAAPVYMLGVVAVNAHNKKGIEAEFARRRLVVPATIAPGDTVQGSLFFRLSPGPQRLVLRGRAGGPPTEITFDLAPLSGLHLKTRLGAVIPPPPAAPPKQER